MFTFEEVDPVHADTASFAGGSMGCKGSGRRSKLDLVAAVHGDTDRSDMGRCGMFVLPPVDDVDPGHADIASFCGGSIGIKGSGLLFGVLSFQDCGMLSRGFDDATMDAPPSSTRLAP